MHGMLVGSFQGTDGGIVEQYFVEDAEIVHDKAFRAGKTSAKACENQDSILTVRLERTPTLRNDPRCAHLRDCVPHLHS
jgi:hypothetical protein